MALGLLAKAAQGLGKMMSGGMGGAPRGGDVGQEVTVVQDSSPRKSLDVSRANSMDYAEKNGFEKLTRQNDEPSERFDPTRSWAKLSYETQSDRSDDGRGPDGSGTPKGIEAGIDYDAITRDHIGIGDLEDKSLDAKTSDFSEAGEDEEKRNSKKRKLEDSSFYEEIENQGDYSELEKQRKDELRIRKRLQLNWKRRKLDHAKDTHTQLNEILLNGTTEHKANFLRGGSGHSFGSKSPAALVPAQSNYKAPGSYDPARQGVSGSSYSGSIDVTRMTVRKQQQEENFHANAENGNKQLNETGDKASVTGGVLGFFENILGQGISMVSGDHLVMSLSSDGRSSSEIGANPMKRRTDGPTILSEKTSNPSRATTSNEGHILKIENKGSELDTARELESPTDKVIDVAAELTLEGALLSVVDGGDGTNQQAGEPPIDEIDTGANDGTLDNEAQSDANDGGRSGKSDADDGERKKIDDNSQKEERHAQEVEEKHNEEQIKAEAEEEVFGEMTERPTLANEPLSSSYTMGETRAELESVAEIKAEIANGSNNAEALAEEEEAEDFVADDLIRKDQVNKAIEREIKENEVNDQLDKEANSELKEMRNAQSDLANEGNIASSDLANEGKMAPSDLANDGTGVPSDLADDGTVIQPDSANGRKSEQLDLANDGTMIQSESADGKKIEQPALANDGELSTEAVAKDTEKSALEATNEASEMIENKELQYGKKEFTENITNYLSEDSSFGLTPKEAGKIASKLADMVERQGGNYERASEVLKDELEGEKKDEENKYKDAKLDKNASFLEALRGLAKDDNEPNEAPQDTRREVAAY